MSDEFAKIAQSIQCKSTCYNLFFIYFLNYNSLSKPEFGQDTEGSILLCQQVNC